MTLSRLIRSDLYRIRYAYVRNIKYSEIRISQDIQHYIQGYRETRAFLIEQESYGGQECIARAAAAAIS